MTVSMACLTVLHYLHCVGRCTVVGDAAAKIHWRDSGKPERHALVRTPVPGQRRWLVGVEGLSASGSTWRMGSLIPASDKGSPRPSARAYLNEILALDTGAADMTNAPDRRVRSESL